MQDDSGEMTEINEDSDEVGKIKCHVYVYALQCIEKK